MIAHNHRILSRPGAIAAAVLLFALGVLLISCAPDGTLTPAGQQLVNVACAADAIGQPAAVTIVPVLLPQAAPAASLDNAIVHPLAIQACGQYAKPIAVAPAVTVSPAAGGGVAATPVPAARPPP